MQWLKVRRRHYHHPELGYSIHGRAVLQRVSARRRLLRLLPALGVLVAVALAVLLTAPLGLRPPGRRSGDANGGSGPDATLKSMTGGILTIRDENGVEYEVLVRPVQGQHGAPPDVIPGQPAQAEAPLGAVPPVRSSPDWRTRTPPAAPAP